MKIYLFLILTGLMLVNKNYSQVSEQYLKLWSDPEIRDRIQSGIEQNRKGYAALQFKTRDGKPNSVTQISIEQISNDFLAGCNLFMIGEFDTEKKNKAYEERFASVFNFGTLPFYWKTLEPNQGELRFGKESAKIYRRPAPDRVLEFCRNNDITPKGHSLLYHHPAFGMPDWFPKDQKEQYSLIVKHIKQIAERYSDQIKYWDVVNELKWNTTGILPKDYAFRTFKLCEEYFSPDNTLTINDGTPSIMDKDEYCQYYQIIQNLIVRGAKVDAIGIQFHLWEEYEMFRQGKLYTPQQVFQGLDLYSDFGRPIHITEITIPTIPNDKTGLETQALIVENLYRLWFSHPSIENIVWWNLADGTALESEDIWNAGLLDKDLNPKPSYNILKKLFTEEWRTKIENVTVNGSSYKFKGFFGKYKIRIIKDGKTIEQEIHLSKDGPKDFVLLL